ncbi:YerC/YecD family TrpR-related protein [Patescibacteria group bacterium]|nr:YerC/YecD family TrpR-related protein [Patescibacteria group bacterium]
MAKPRTEVEDKEYYKEIHFLYEIINSLKNVQEIKLFIKDILTKSELRMLKRRWHIANLLMQGQDIRTTAYKSKTSTATVIKIKQILEEGKGGLKLAIDRSKKYEKKEKEDYLKSKRPVTGSNFVKGWFK